MCGGNGGGGGNDNEMSLDFGYDPSADIAAREAANQ